MFIIGLLGGVAAGKSLVARQLAQRGAVVLDADRLGHEVLTEPEVQAALRERWGECVFAEGGAVDRAAVAQKVFAPPPVGPPELAFLERLTHPRIGDRLRRQLEQLAANGTQVVVLDAPVMMKSGWHKACNHILFVEASASVREARAAARGWNQDEFRRRAAAQEPIETKRAAAHTLIDNSGPPEATTQQVEQFWRQVVEPATQSKIKNLQSEI